MVEGRITVVLADDNLIVREGVRALLSLEDDLEVVGVAADYDELIAAAEAATPQVVVTDIRMPPSFQTEGIDAANMRLRYAIAAIAAPPPATSKRVVVRCQLHELDTLDLFQQGGGAFAHEVVVFGEHDLQGLRWWSHEQKHREPLPTRRHLRRSRSTMLPKWSLRYLRGGPAPVRAEQQQRQQRQVGTSGRTDRLEVSGG